MTEHEHRVEIQYADVLKKHLAHETQKNADLIAVLREVRKKKKALKARVVKLTWIARAMLGIDDLEAMLDEPVDFGYKKHKTPKVYEHPVPKVLPRTAEFLRRVEAEKLASSSPAIEKTVYADEEQDPEDVEIPPKLEEPKISVFKNPIGTPFDDRYHPRSRLSPPFNIEPHFTAVQRGVIVNNPALWKDEGRPPFLRDLSSDDEGLPPLLAVPPESGRRSDVVDIFSPAEKALLMQFEPMGEYPPLSESTLIEAPVATETPK
jgi:hypothetical protein